MLRHHVHWHLGQIGRWTVELDQVGNGGQNLCLKLFDPTRPDGKTLDIAARGDPDTAASSHNARTRIDAAFIPDRRIELSPVCKKL